MLPADKQLLLSGFLGQLPEQAATRLAKAVEVDRLMGGIDLPHEQILSALRPQLRQATEPQRIGTPLRYFCRPFEDILVSSRTLKQKGRIARSSIQPVWKWLETQLMPERHRTLTNAIRGAILKDRDLELDGRLAMLWHEAAPILKSALGDEQRKIAAGRTLGSYAIAEDAAEMALLIGGAEEVIGLQKRLPKPIPVLTELDIEFLREVFDRLCGSDPDLAPYVALIVMGRLARPWEALRLAAVVSRKATDTMISSTDVGAVGELLFDDLEIHTKKIQAVKPTKFDTEELLANLAAFCELSRGMVKELGIRRDGKWGHRLSQDRAAVSAIMEGLVERAPKEIFAGLPGKTAGFGKGPKSLEVERAPDQDRVARAMRYAHLLVHCRQFSVAAAFSAKLSEAMDEISTALRSYNEDILREVRSAPHETRANVERHFANALDICKLVLGDDEADFLRRRSHLAAANA